MMQFFAFYFIDSVALNVYCVQRFFFSSDVIIVIIIVAVVVQLYCAFSNVIFFPAFHARSNECN